MITDYDEKDTIEKAAHKRVVKIMVIFSLLTILILYLIAVQSTILTAMLFAIILVPILIVYYVVIKKFALREEKIKNNIILENEEFYLSGDGTIIVEPISDEPFLKDLKERATFTAKQNGNYIIVYLSYDGEKDKYLPPIEFDIVAPGHLLENYKFVR